VINLIDQHGIEHIKNNDVEKDPDGGVNDLNEGKLVVCLHKTPVDLAMQDKYTKAAVILYGYRYIMINHPGFIFLELVVAAKNLTAMPDHLSITIARTSGVILFLHLFLCVSAKRTHGNSFLRDVVDTALSVTQQGETVPFVITRENGRYGVSCIYGGKNKELLPCVYDNYRISAGYIAFSRQGRWALYDFEGYYAIKKGKISWERQPVFITDFIYDSVSAPRVNDFMILYKAGLSNVVYQKGGVIFPVKEQPVADLFPGWCQELRQVNGRNYQVFFIARRDNNYGIFRAREHSWLVATTEMRISHYQGDETDYFYCESDWRKRIVGKYDFVKNKFAFEITVDSAGGKNGGLYYVNSGRFVELIKAGISSADVAVAIGNNHFLYEENGRYGIRLGDMTIRQPQYITYKKLNSDAYNMYELYDGRQLSFFMPDYNRFALSDLEVAAYRYADGFFVFQNARDNRWYFVNGFFRDRDDIHSQLSALDSVAVRKIFYSYVREGRPEVLGFKDGQMIVTGLGTVRIPLVAGYNKPENIFPEVKGYSYRTAEGKVGFTGAGGALPAVFNELTVVEEREDGKSVLLFRGQTDRYVLYVIAKDVTKDAKTVPAFVYCGKCRGSGRIYSETVKESVMVHEGYTREYVTQTPRLSGGYTIKTTTVTKAPTYTTQSRDIYKTCSDCKGHGRHYFTITQ
jgi:hypothetical protein